MNFFANFGRVNSISISKIAIKSQNQDVLKHLFDMYLRLLPAFSINTEGGAGWSQRIRYVTEEGVTLLTLWTITGRGQEGPDFCQKQRYVTFDILIFLRATLHHQREQNVIQMIIFNILQPQATTQILLTII